jgi:tetratricopeptide (TPR) repeat protein
MERRTIRWLFVGLAIASWVAAILWFIVHPGFEPLIAVFTGLASLLGSFAFTAQAGGGQTPEAAAPLPRAPYMPPRPLSEFVGREQEITRLSRLLRPGSGTVTGLVGMSGLGKTELAKLVAHRVAGRFRDGVLWADCNEQDLEIIADLWAAEYGVPLPGDSLASKAAAWRGLASAKEALLILDNVQPGQNVDPLIPALGKCAVLITSRDAGHPALRGAPQLVLDQFTPEEAMALAEEVLGGRLDPDQAVQAERLFKQVGHLPLAVSVALHLAEECGWRLATLNRELEGRGALQVLGEERSLEKGLLATFEAAVGCMPQDLQETFRTAALFNAGPSFGTRAMAETLGLTEEEATAQLRRLAGRSLLTELGDSRWSLHPLLRQFATTLPPAEEASRARFTRHYLDVVETAGRLYLEGGQELLRGLALFDREWPHIRAGQAWACGEAARTSADPAGVVDEATRLCSDYARLAVGCLSLRLHPRDWIAWLEAARFAACRLPDRKAEAAHLGNLGTANRLLGNARLAIEYHEQALAISLEVGDRHGEGQDLGSLGLACASVGETERAIEYYERALGVSRELGDRRDEGNWLVSLGQAYARMDNTQMAIEFYEQALVLSRQTGDRRLEGTVLGSLGNARLDLGDARGAIEHYGQALDVAREIGDRWSEEAHLGNLGEVYRVVEDLAQAIKHHEEALHVSREIGDLKGEATHLANLGLAHAAVGDHVVAGELWTQALGICETIEDPRSEELRAWLEGPDGRSGTREPAH